MKTRKLMQGKLQMVAIIAVSVMFGMLVSACGTAKKSAKAGTETQTVQEANNSKAGEERQPVVQLNKYLVDKNTEKKLQLDKVCEAPDKIAEFPGGIQAMMEYLSKNTKYPEEALKTGVRGRVIIRVVVATDGHLYKPEIMMSADPLLNDEALRVIMSMPVWKPAEMNDGTKVNMKINIPINFIPRK